MRDPHRTVLGPHFMTETKDGGCVRQLLMVDPAIGHPDSTLHWTKDQISTAITARGNDRRHLALMYRIAKETHLQILNRRAYYQTPLRRRPILERKPVYFTFVHLKYAKTRVVSLRPPGNRPANYSTSVCERTREASKRSKAGSQQVTRVEYLHVRLPSAHCLKTKADEDRLRQPIWHSQKDVDIFVNDERLHGSHEGERPKIDPAGAVQQQVPRDTSPDASCTKLQGANSNGADAGQFSVAVTESPGEGCFLPLVPAVPVELLRRLQSAAAFVKVDDAIAVLAKVNSFNDPLTNARKGNSCTDLWRGPKRLRKPILCVRGHSAWMKCR